MGKAKEYNGWPSWNAWNVALWVNNDYHFHENFLYCHENMTRKDAIDTLVEWFGGKKTPDGGVFNRRTITLALEGMD